MSSLLSPPPLRSRWWALRAIASVMVLGSLAFDRSPLFAVAILFVLVVPFEKKFPRHPQPFRRSFLGLDLGYALSQPFLGLLTLTVGVFVAGVSLAWLPGLAFRPLVALLPPVAEALIGFVVFDFIIYWAHRWSHEVPFLWRFHSVHHSIESMDWISAFRSHPADGLIVAPAIGFMLAAGFSAETTGVLTVLQIVTGIFLHANVRWKWRRLQRLVITPEFHHWHHANEPDALNSNYSIFLPAWDMAFGSWFMPPDRRPMLYGVDEPVPPTMAAQLLYPFSGLQSPLWMIRHPWRGTRHTIRLFKSGVRQLWRSARRPRRPFVTPRSSELAVPSDQRVS